MGNCTLKSILSLMMYYISIIYGMAKRVNSFLLMQRKVLRESIRD